MRTHTIDAVQRKIAIGRYQPNPKSVPLIKTNIDGTKHIIDSIKNIFLDKFSFFIFFFPPSFFTK
jgi:hypothetical protein